ncbi:MAG: 3-phenylpropionate dioxygenase [Alcaligenaceae bacterium]|nr:3-phenylpropionate dioxygenase [Alcaligenaceae bacterium SAGV5]MPS53155.1 3-phenylpropionate dioxygenase [Alcaligenaceae bacterium SAGV3]MPT55407.1 3-phenylpropionate dioxygenase [Alcaligenaceae bacterium]
MSAIVPSSASAGPSSTPWTRNDYSRVPFHFYHDAGLFQQEMERIFRGPTWNYLALEAEFPQVGDFRLVSVGDTPVVVSRSGEQEFSAFVNRCAHKGAQIVRKAHGNAKEHVCIYHRWCYSNKGRLVGVPFRRGLRGEGGMPQDFSPASVSPRALRVVNFHGMLFGTFADELETLEDYLGEFGTSIIPRFFHKPIEVIGYSRQLIRGNWKLYAENLRDTYHASLLHEFFVTYGVDRATQKGGVKMDARHRHNMNHAYAASDTQDTAREAYAGIQGVELDRLRLTDTQLLRHDPEFTDRMSLAAPTFFPNMVLIQINNSLSTRQIRPRNVDEVEVFTTLFGYRDDTEDMRRHRLMSANLVGPAGLVSMEDGEAIELVHRATGRDPGGEAVVEMGGRGPLGDLAHRVTETPVRGFWSYYSELMGIEPEGAIR